MKAAVLVEPGRFEIEDRPLPSPAPDEVLIKVERAGLCGTDLHIFNGDYSADLLPMVPGHEIAGRIEGLGSAVENLSKGQKVAVDCNLSCGTCYWCRRNERLSCPEISQLGIHRDGGFCEYICWPARLLVLAPEDMGFSEIALVEPLACVVRAAKKARVGGAKSLVVLGAGAMGNLHIQMARHLGAAPIIAFDTSKQRRELALAAGADFAVGDDGELADAVERATDGVGADLVIESVGTVALYEMAQGLMRKGGHLALFGLTHDDDSMKIPLLEWILTEKSAKGSVAGMGEDMHDAMRFLRFSRIQTGSFTGSPIALDDIGAAFDKWGDNPASLKTQIAMN